MNPNKKQQFYTLEWWDGEADTWVEEQRCDSFDMVIKHAQHLINGFDSANRVPPPLRARYGSVQINLWSAD